MIKRIELEVEGFMATAWLLEEMAPNTVRHIWEVLPIRQTLRHTRWSGSAAYIAEPCLIVPTLPIENKVSFCIPGDIVFEPTNGSFLFSYGQAQVRDRTGNVWATHFASIEGNYRPFLDMMQRTQCEGAKKIVIRKKEE